MTHDKWQTPYALGFSVFPLRPYGKKPAGPWKQWQTQRATPELVAQWAQAPQLNVGIATGALSGCIVIDLDNDDAIARAYAHGLPHTLCARTPRGLHVYLQHPGGHIRNAAAIEEGIDLRGDGGFVVAPGSVYVPTVEEAADGKREGHYTWVDPTVPLAPAPVWTYESHRTERRERVVTVATAYRGPSAYGTAALERELATLADAPHGARNQTINAVSFAIGQLVAGGWLPEEETYDALELAVTQIGSDPHKDADTMERAWHAGMAAPRVLDPEQAFGTVPPAPPEGAAPSPPLSLVQAAGLPPVSVGPAVRPSILTASQLPDYFKGVVYIVERDEFFTPEGLFLKRSAFDGAYSGPKFYIAADGTEPCKSPSDAFLRNEAWVAPRAHRTCFRPELPPGALVQDEGLVWLNCYVPVPVQRTPGAPARFVQHVHKMLPNGDDAELLLHWMASAVQNPGAKFFWWPVVQGVKGNGKTLLLEVMVYCMSLRYSHMVNPESMARTGNQFNGWIENKLFLGFEEVRTNERRDLLELLKPMVTNRRSPAERKGKDQTTIDNRANGLALTNYKDAIPIEDGERRYGIFYTAQQDVADLARDGMTGGYFPALYDWLRNGGYAVVAHYLATRPLDAAMDPARELVRAPVTTSTAEAVQESLGVVEQEILDAIDEGREGFRAGLISSKAIAALCASLRRSMPPRKMRAMMQALGYDWHPALRDGRVNQPVGGVYGGKPKLYVRKGHPLEALDALGVAAAYDAAQVGGAIAAPLLSSTPNTATG